MMPLSLLAGSFFDNQRVFGKKWQRIFSPPVKYGLVGAFIAVNIYFQWNDYHRKPDKPKEVAAFLNAHLRENDVIYTGNYHHIVYHLLDKDCPTPYVHRSLLWYENTFYRYINTKKEIHSRCCDVWLNIDDMYHLMPAAYITLTFSGVNTITDDIISDPLNRNRFQS